MKEKSNFSLFLVISVLLITGFALIDSREITGMQSADVEKSSLPQIMENVPSYSKLPNAPGINFDKVEIKCGRNEVGGDAKEGYWTKNFCQEKEGNIFNFDSSKDGEERAKSLCDKNQVKEKIAELYNSINCPSNCPLKKQLVAQNAPIKLCNPGILFGSTIHCSSKIFFNCEAKSAQPIPQEIKKIIATVSKSDLSWRPPIDPTHGITESNWLRESVAKGWRPPIDPSHGIVESNWLEQPQSKDSAETPQTTLGWRPPITPTHGIVESNWLRETIAKGWHPPIQPTHGIVESNWLSQTPSATPKPSPTPSVPPIPGVTPTQNPSPSPSPSPTPSEPKPPKDPNSPCSLENMAKQVDESLNEAKEHFERMENPEEFIGSLGPKILRPEILANFCKNPKMDLTEFINFHISEACDAVNTGSPRCREKIGKLLACDDSVFKELSEYGVTRDSIRNICRGGKTKEELNKITQNCIDLWEKSKDEFMKGIHTILRAKCPPLEPTPPPIIPEPTPTRPPPDPVRTPTLPPSLPRSPPVADCPPDMIKVGENKCACPEGKVMIDKTCKTCAEAVPAGFSTQSPNYESAILAILNKERCVSGARITLPGKAQRGPCLYYSTGDPKVEVDRTPPICQSPCGPIQCDTSRSCPCPGKPNCTLRVTCGWGGWQKAGENQYIAKIAFR